MHSAPDPTSMKRPPRHYLRSLTIIVLLLAGSSTIAGWLYSVRVTPPRRDVGIPPPYVETLVIEPETVTERYLGYGVAGADRSARLAAEIASTVLERVDNIRVGSRVNQGQVLLRFDDREYRAALERAMALVAADTAAIDELSVLTVRLEATMRTAEDELRVAASELERVSGLFERDLAAEKEMNVAKLAYQQARRLVQEYEREIAVIPPRRAGLESSRQSNEAAAEIARLNMERCHIRAPFDGVIEELAVDVGDRVAAGTHVATVLDPSIVEIPIRLPGSVYEQVRIGAPCDLMRETTPDVNWTGEVARIAPNIDALTRTFTAFLVVDNRRQERPLVPGTFLRASVYGPTHHDALVVPRSAIRDGRVFVAKNGKAHARRINIRHYVEERAVVEGAISRGDRIILSSLDIITDGSPVRIAERASAERTAHHRPSAETPTPNPGNGSQIETNRTPSVVNQPTPADAQP